MPISPLQKTAIEEVIAAVLGVADGKRKLSSMFMDLVDRIEWADYYQIIPEPRCLKNIQAGVARGRYKEATDVYTDLSLVFWNALFYNETGSQIALDAESLKNTLETEWKRHPVLPSCRTSPPPSSAQKVHATDGDDSTEALKEEEEEESSDVATPIPSTHPPTPAPAPAATLPPAPTTRIIAPSNQNRIAPTASTSQLQPQPIPLHSSQKQATPDIEVDVVSPESDGQEEARTAFQAERDPLSEEIVKQLEKGLPRWPGLGEEGWMNEINPEHYSDIVHAVKSYKDVVGNRLAVCLEALPEESSPSLNLSSTAPLSLKQIETRARHKMYKSSKEFDMDFARLFEKARRFHEPGSEAYGRSLLLQRLYQALTSPNPPNPPYVSSTNFAALKAGPGNVKPVHGSDGDGTPNVTTHRVLTRDRTFVEEVNYKGWKVKLADWVHLSNPDDPSKPIIGQVFRCWLSDEADKKGQPGITVSWYYRPEQTFHYANRQFWEGEVFKTSHFADHPVEDIIEKVACQFTARHIRGRPRPPFWYVGFPLYVCDSRYNDRDRIFVRIKNWNSCVPEEVRQTPEFMPIYPFERTVYPVRLPSPFLVKGSGKGAAKGPGGIIPGGSDQAEGPGDPEAARKRTARNETPVRNTLTAPMAYQVPPLPASVLPYIAPRAAGPDRSVVSAAGGLAAIGGPAQVEKLSADTTKYFDRDPETGEVLWFAAPPLNVARPRSGARHSLEYLQFLARKRKQGQTGENDGVQTKRSRPSVTPTVMETTLQVLKEMEF